MKHRSGTHKRFDKALSPFWQMSFLISSSRGYFPRPLQKRDFFMLTNYYTFSGCGESPTASCALGCAAAELLRRI
ncbi:hypothetical protein KCP69_05065 [Salmonella enterica subsp. enterica]|nr:hypothetical protein KCP69_05065 [Salmonella enterica subsp. enterica]